MSLLLLLACAPDDTLGAFVVVTRDDGSLDVTRGDGKPLVSGLRFAAGDGTEVLEMKTGAYRVVDGSTTWRPLRAQDPHGKGPARTWRLRTDDGNDVGSLTISDDGGKRLRFDVSADGNRVRWDAACTGDDRFAGLGAHAFDVEHGGEAFGLWVSEPGIGKVDDEELPDDWFYTGTRHASSFPSPYVVRPEPYALTAVTDARVEVDLCSGGERWTMDGWEGGLTYMLEDGDSTLEVVSRHALWQGVPLLPPDWALAPWNDAVGGSARVRAVAQALRDAGAPSSVIWTEDWKGGEESAWGYHLKPEWDLDTGLYPDAVALDDDLEALGFKWFAYFSPFLVEGYRAWDEAAQYAVVDADGEPYTFIGVTFEPTSVLDLTRADARAWAQDKMQAAVDIGFDGWMTDYGEWLPPDARLAEADAMDDHNAYPDWWHATNAELLADLDAAWFTRSGWLGGHTVSPVHWVGDQATGFSMDDGLPTVVPMMIGTAMTGAPLVTHDVAGYQSIEGASTEELWLRWCALGAFSPVMRTHHGTEPEDNVQFDENPTTLAAWARYATVHVELFPYRRSLLALAEDEGTPLVRPLFLHHPDEDWGRTDAFLLGPSLLVAPVVEQGVAGRQVDLPASTTWYDWWSGDRVESGWFDVPVGEIAVFAPAGAIVPLYTEAPDTLVDGPLPGVITRGDVEGARTVRVFPGPAGSFVEADGTIYRTTGTGTGAGTASATFASGTLEAGGITLTVEGSVERTYVLEVAAP
jgi:alpha-glucosidase (family GH31 glycosyl hydrolase)